MKFLLIFLTSIAFLAGAVNADVVLRETWESGINADVWHLFGTPEPCLYAGQYARGTQSLEDMGDNSARSGIVTAQTFTLQAGFSVSYAINVNATGEPGPWTEYTSSSWNISTSDPATITENSDGSGATYTVITHSPEADAHVFLGDSTIAISNDYAQWRMFRFTVQTDGTVYYYRDDEYVGRSVVAALASVMGEEICLIYAGETNSILTLMDDITVTSGETRLELPEITCEEGDSVEVAVTASISEARSAGLAFLADSGVVESVTLLHHAFETDAFGMANLNTSGDTVFVGLFGSEPLTLNDDTLAVFMVRVKETATPGTTALHWIASETCVDDREAELTDGTLIIPAPPLFGDATGDGTITTEDAVRVLEKYVHLPCVINETLAEVSGNGRLTPYDAALIVYRVINTGYVFPAEGGFAPPRQAASGRTVTVTPDGTGWTCNVDNPAGIISGGMTFRVDETTQVTGPGILKTHRTGGLLRVAFVRSGSNSPTLLHLTGETAPVLLTASLNERSAQCTQPGQVALSQNLPNPFNPVTSISFTLPAQVAVRLTIYSVTGQLVKTLAHGEMTAGTHVMTWNGRDDRRHEVAAGVYVYRLEADGMSVTRRMLLVR